MCGEGMIRRRRRLLSSRRGPVTPRSELFQVHRGRGPKSPFEMQAGDPFAPSIGELGINHQRGFLHVERHSTRGSDALLPDGDEVVAVTPPSRIDMHRAPAASHEMKRSATACRPDEPEVTIRMRTIRAPARKKEHMDWASWRCGVAPRWLRCGPARGWWCASAANHRRGPREVGA
jgi:hypothetical protein